MNRSATTSMTLFDRNRRSGAIPQPFPDVLVEDAEHPVFAAVIRLILGEVVGPNMCAMLRAKPDARSVAQP